MKTIQTGGGAIRAAGRATFTTLLTLLAVCAWSSTASAKKIELDGEFIQEFQGVPTSGAPRPGDPTTVDFTLTGTQSTATGTWEGQIVTTHGEGTINLLTGEASGTADATFIGSSDGVGTGTISIRGDFKFGPVDPATGRQTLIEKSRIIDGTGDFAGSRGEVTFTGSFVGGLGKGDYSGAWRLSPARDVS